MTEDYYRIEALSASGAKMLLPPNCPAIYRWQRDNPKPPTEAMQFGTALHTLVLGVGPEPVAIEGGRGKAERFAGAREAGNLPLTPDDYDTAQAMAQAVRDDADAWALLAPGGTVERPILWERDGVQFKAKPDYHRKVTNNSARVVDLKTTASADPEQFSRSIANYGYATQGAFYEAAVRTIYGENINVDHYLIAVSKEAPHPVSVYVLDAEAMMIGRANMATATAIYRQCIESGEWPGHTNGITPIGVPAWYANQYDELDMVV